MIDSVDHGQTPIRAAWTRAYIFFRLNSAEHDIFPILLINVKMPTIVGILTFMSRKNSIIGFSEPDQKAELLDIFMLMSI